MTTPADIIERALRIATDDVQHLGGVVLEALDAAGYDIVARREPVQLGHEGHWPLARAPRPAGPPRICALCDLPTAYPDYPDWPVDLCPVHYVEFNQWKRAEGVHER